ncbi:tigger transposable element derived 6-like protein [Plakobranchus ocellatus]|uniref:Tigger transposable element derived 6-like protein n=1 Tax=Plakobranchus ocellatus TaxID=259542 RepID=A0AAV4A1Q9_9GAST|nr:tigger transposable element derived 6-like protein [Plakobranchus ocellatus]
MSILDASVMAAASWNEVTPSTIRNCFRHAGFVRNTESEPEEGEQVSGEDLHEVSNLFERFAQVAKDESAADDEDVAIQSVTSGAALQAMEQVQTYVMQQAESGTGSKALQLVKASQETVYHRFLLQLRTTEAIKPFNKEDSHPN